MIGIKEAGIGLVARSSWWNADVNADGDPQNISLQEKYDNAYLNFPIVNACVDTTTEQVVQDFYFEGPHKEKITTWADDINLGQKLIVITKHMLKNGNLWVEMPNKTEMKFINPKTITTWRKSNGDIIGHSQEIDGKKVALWGTTGKREIDKEFTKKRPLKEIVHFKFNVLAGDKYGTSIIHSVLPLLSIKDQIEGDLKVIVRRYSAPIIHAKVGDDMHLPSDADITSVKKSLKDIYSDTEYVTNHLTELIVLGFEGKALNLDYILKHIDMNIVSGLQTPSELIGLGTSNKAEAEVKLRNFGRHIKSIQRAIKIEFEDNIIVGQGLGNRKDKIIWAAAEEREQEIDIDQIRGLVTDGIITPQKGNDLLTPRFHEKLPEEMKTRNPMMAQNVASQNQDQKPFQKGGDKIKDNPTDPTLKQKEPGERRVKTDRKVPLK